MINAEIKNLHIQNVFDALNFGGFGVKGKLMEKCLYLQNRSVLMGRGDDVVVVTKDFPEEFGSYIKDLKQNDNISIIPVNFDLEEAYGADQLFLNLDKKMISISFDKGSVTLLPYIHSKSFYSAAKKYGWKISEAVWETYVDEDISASMNDKVFLHEECLKLGIPVPKYLALTKDNFVNEVLKLLDESNKILVRQSRSGGGLGNLTIEKINESEFKVDGIKDEGVLNISEFNEFLNQFANDSNSDDFVVSQFLDLYASPGTLFHIDEESIDIVSHTNQILNDQSTFTGFQYPISDEKITSYFPIIEEYVSNLGKAWQAKGYRGYGNIDWMITKEGCIYIAERNARQTSVVPILSLISDVFNNENSTIQLPQDKVIYAKDFVFINKKLSFAKIINELKNKNLLFDKEKGTGLIITIPPVIDLEKTVIGITSIGENEHHAYQLFHSVNFDQ